ncbi:hypothetical protein Q1695_015702 [Nippostrongylus brasiliensis]|nr:hypothetical protein Q1695_015702 [Nippostrongylus brasiliensis]
MNEVCAVSLSLKLCKSHRLLGMGPKHKDYMDTSKWEIDKGYLTKECYTPVFREEMHISGAVKMDRQAKANVLVIGLGAGYFNAYLHSVFPKFNVTGVDIEPEMVRIALKWYGLVLDDRQHVYTMDGVDYLKQAASEGTKFDVIFVDACIMNLKLDVLCPVPIFLSKDVVRSMYEVLQEGGNDTSEGRVPVLYVTFCSFITS